MLHTPAEVDALRVEVARLRQELTAARRAAVTDPLTGVANRAGLAGLHSALDAGPGLLVLLDVDRFKAINDTHGHPVGDQVLITLASRLAGYAGDGRVVRLGGDEFAALLPAASDPEAELARLRAHLAGPVPVPDGPDLTVTTTIGAVVTDPGTPVGRLLAAADAAMYRARRDRIGVAVYRPGTDHPYDPDRHAPRPADRFRDLTSTTGPLTGVSNGRVA